MYPHRIIQSFSLFHVLYRSRYESIKSFFIILGSIFSGLWIRFQRTDEFCCTNKPVELWSGLQAERPLLFPLITRSRWFQSDEM